MKVRIALVVALATASITAPATAQTSISNNQVIEMVKAGLPDDVIASAIKAGGKPLDASPMALVALKQAGVSDAVLRAVVESTAPKATTAPQASPSYQMPDMAMFGGGGVIMIDGTKETNLTLTAIGYRPGMMMMFTGMTLGKAIAIIKSGPATIRSASRRPSFRISTGVSDAPQNSWGIVPLTGSSNALKFDYHSVLNMSKDKLVPITYKEVARSQFMVSWLITPNTDMLPGEYVVISGNEGGVQPYQFGVD